MSVYIAFGHRLYKALCLVTSALQVSAYGHGNGVTDMATLPAL